MSLTATVYCLIEKGDKILLTRDQGKMGWKLPGGRVEEGELIYDAVVREVEEETGLKVCLKKLVCIQDYLKEDAQHRLRVYTTAEPLGGSEGANNEVEEIKWVSKSELENLKEGDFFIKQYFEATRRYLSNDAYPLEIIANFIK